MQYWPFWLGGAALGGISVLMWWLDARLLGVSGQVTRIVDALDAHPLEPHSSTALEVNEIEVATSRAAETHARVGAGLHALGRADDGGAHGDPLRRSPQGPAMRAAFLAAIVVGAFVASLATDQFGWRESFGPVFEGFVGTGAGSWLLLLGGGVMVGFGTRMSGGCTSGHGLSGCGRLQPGSLVGTATFLGTAVVFSLLLRGLQG